MLSWSQSQRKILFQTTKIFFSSKIQGLMIPNPPMNFDDLALKDELNRKIEIKDNTENMEKLN